MTRNAGRAVLAVRGRRLMGGPIDHLPRLLRASYALRYQVYCRERKFLPAGDYPNRLEIDEFDGHSNHVGALDAHGVLVGTARLVTTSDIGLPLLRHCTTFPHESKFRDRDARFIEVGRLAVSRSFKRPDQSLDAAGTRRRGREDVFLTLLDALYQQTQRLDATHWLFAMEASLQRLLLKHGIPIRAIGPETDYFGMVTPYQLDLKEFDHVILSRRFPGLDPLLIGPEPEFRPRADEDGEELELASAGGGSAFGCGPSGESLSHGV